MDSLYSMNTIEHPTSPTPTFNVMFRDAHVVSVALPPVVYGYLQTIAPQFTFGFPNYPGTINPFPPPLTTGPWPGGNPILSTLQSGFVQSAVPDGKTILNYAVGLTNYIDLIETIGTGGNPLTMPDGSATPASDPYDMMTELRFGLGTPPLYAN
jgi:hypothetical protein